MNDTDTISAPVRLSGRVDTNNAEQVQKELIDALDRAPGNKRGHRHRCGRTRLYFKRGSAGADEAF